MSHDNRNYGNLKGNYDPRLAAYIQRSGLPSRIDRTPYYATDIPAVTAKALMMLQKRFVRQYKRDYSDDDPQFWTPNLATGKPVPQPDLEIFIRALADGMAASNHHPAHVHAVRTTKTLIFGCGDCVDDCPKCNFRYVPEGWTRSWKLAVEHHERWYTELETPALQGVTDAGETLNWARRFQRKG